MMKENVKNDLYNVHFSKGMLSNCHQIDHIKGVEDFQGLIDKIFGGTGGWNEAHQATQRVLGKDDYKLWFPFRFLANSYKYFVQRGGMKKNQVNDASFSDLMNALAQCYAALDWGKRMLKNAKADSREDVEAAKEALLGLERLYNHIGFEVRVAGRNQNSNWDM